MINRTATGLCCAAALGLAATLSAQAPATTTSQPGSSTDKEVTISGCLAKGASGFTLNNARIEPNASSSTTTAGSTSTTASGTTTTGSATTTGGSGTTGTTGAMAAGSSPAMTWMLSGDSDLDKHVGHKIQVTGKTTWDASMAPSATSTTGGSTTTATSSTTTAGSANQPRLDVKSIKMVSASCS